MSGAVVEFRCILLLYFFLSFILLRGMGTYMMPCFLLDLSDGPALEESDRVGSRQAYAL